LALISFVLLPHHENCDEAEEEKSDSDCVRDNHRHSHMRMTSAPDDALVPAAHFDRRQCDCDYHDCQKTGLYEEMNFNHTADAHFLDGASAAVAVAAEAVGAAELARYGHPPGAGSTPACPNPHLRVKKLASRQSKSNKQRLLRKRSDESHPHPPGLA